jgi:hypothetical protein
MIPRVPGVTVAGSDDDDDEAVPIVAPELRFMANLCVESDRSGDGVADIVKSAKGTSNEVPGRGEGGLL